MHRPAAARGLPPLSAWLRCAAVIVLATRVAAAEPERPHAIYLDLLGKGGVWGAGYDWQPAPRFALGATASYYLLGGDRVASLCPYAAAYPVIRGHHRWFVQAGPQVVRRTTPSPVPQWQGMTTTGYGGELSSGYEYRNKLLVRGYAMATVGEHVAPWLGASVGWTF